MTKNLKITTTNKCFGCSNKQNIQTYFNLNYYNSITTNYEPVYLCNDPDCKNYLLDIVKWKDCPSHSQFTNINTINQTELNNHE